jgi:predicted RNA-binding Zn ribbon-like protein
MMTTSTEPQSKSSEPLLIADDVALDFLNTRYGVGAGRRECLVSDDSVLQWMRRAGLPVEEAASGLLQERGALLKVALELRETTRRLIEKRKTGGTGDPRILNRILALESSHEQLTWKKRPAPVLTRHQVPATFEAVLVPIATAVARLLVDGDFSMVRQCEGGDCTLWFYDRTKSHHRRWCSMALCGNRAKVAAYRARQHV